MEQTENAATGEDIVTPWDVAASSAAGVDYDKLIREFLRIFHYFFREIRMSEADSGSAGAV